MKLIVSMLCSLMLLIGSTMSFAESNHGNSTTTTPPEQMDMPHNAQQNKQHSQDGSSATSGSGNDIQKLKKKSETESKANKSRDMQKENSGNSY